MHPLYTFVAAGRISALCSGATSYSIQWHGKYFLKRQSPGAVFFNSGYTVLNIISCQRMQTLHYVNQTGKIWHIALQQHANCLSS